MNYVGVELHKHSISVCVMIQDGSGRRVVTRARFSCRDEERIYEFFAKLRPFQTQNLQLSAIKVFNEVNRTQQALGYANQLAALNREAKLPTDPFQLKFAVKDRLESELGAIKADLEYRSAVVEVRSLAGLCE